LLNIVFSDKVYTAAKGYGVQECDTTMPNSIANAGNKKFSFFIFASYD